MSAMLSSGTDRAVRGFAACSLPPAAPWRPWCGPGAWRQAGDTSLEVAEPFAAPCCVVRILCRLPGPAAPSPRATGALPAMLSTRSGLSRTPQPPASSPPRPLGAQQGRGGAQREPAPGTQGRACGRVRGWRSQGHRRVGSPRAVLAPGWQPGGLAGAWGGPAAARLATGLWPPPASTDPAAPGPTECAAAVGLSACCEGASPGLKLAAGPWPRSGSHIPLGRIGFPYALPLPQELAAAGAIPGAGPGSPLPPAPQAAPQQPGPGTAPLPTLAVHLLPPRPPPWGWGPCWVSSMWVPRGGLGLGASAAPGSSAVAAAGAEPPPPPAHTCAQGRRPGCADTAWGAPGALLPASQTEG